ncbi:unnamed protein product, partial [Brenthis ino]
MPIGKLEQFELDSKEWPAYIRRVKQYMLLNEVKEELKVSLLITVVGKATYSLMCDLCSPSHPETKSFDELVKLVSEHLEPQRSEIAERHVFRLRRQRTGEPLSEYLQCLKHLATTCNFGTTLEENLRDQFVSGLASDAMRSRIFAERNIKYREAVELAMALEAAERHAEVSGSRTSTGTSGAGSDAAGEGLHAASARRARPGGGGGGAPAQAPRAAPRSVDAQLRCWRCGRGHRADRCRFAQYNCDECNQRGHLKVMCKEVRNRSYGRHKYVSETDKSEDEFFNIQLAAKGNKPYLVIVKMDGRPIECEIDTGSRISAVSEQFYQQNFTHKHIVSDNLLLKCYSGSRIESLGYISVDVSLGNERANNLSLYIIKNGGRPLLGREWIRALKIKQISFNEITDDQFVSCLREEFPEVFSEQLGENISQALSKFLFQYRNCEHTTTAVSPAVALLGRRLRGRLDALRPDVGAVVLEAQSKQVDRAGGTNRELQLGDTVLTRDYTTKGEKWSEGTVTKKTGPVSFKVDVGGGVEWRRHQDQMIQLGNRKEKNRYSLARTSTTASADANEEQTPGVDDDADDQCSEAPETGANAGRALRSPGLPGPAGEPATPPPPPDASARAIRAYKRAIIQKDKKT